MLNNKVLLSTSAAVISLVSHPCWGQAVPPAPSPTVTASAVNQTEPSANAADQQADQTAGDIVVTAQRREQRLQDVPVAITALSGDTIQNAGISSVEGLQTAVPNITIGASFGFANLFIRGLGLNTVFANVDPSVTLYENGAVISQPGAQLLSFYDLDRIEVLRGPQGTLYGRNATGGTINLITAKPTNEFSGYIRADGGNYAHLEVEGAVSGPITDTLSARASFFTTRQDGFGRNIVTGNDVADASTQAARGQLHFKPSANFVFDLLGEYARERDAANALFFKRETFPTAATGSALAPAGRGGFPTGKPRDYASDIDPVNDRKTYSITGTAKLNLSDQISLTNILNYRKFDSTLVQDLDLSAVVTSSIQEYIFNSKHWSEEFQLSYDGSRFHAIAGAYYFNEHLDHTNAFGRSRFSDIYPTTAPGGGRRVYLLGKGETETWALFWNANYKITDTLTLRGGGRYTSDTRTVDNTGYVFVAPTRQVFFPGPDGKRTFRDYTNEGGIDYRPTRDIMLYYTYSEGFKAGTGQLGVTTGSIVNPETIKNHEAGVKSEFADGRLTLNVAGYIYKLKGLQLDQTRPCAIGPTCPTGYITEFQNATSQKSHGVELEAIWRPTSEFRTNLSLAYQHTEFGHFLSVNPTDPTASLTDIFGNRARNSPKWVGSFHTEYDLFTGNGGKLTPGLDASYKSKVFYSEFNDPLLSQGNYAIFDAHLRYTFPNSKIQATVWVKNFTDRLVEGANFAVATGRVVARTFLPPRTFGASIKYNF